MIANRTIANAEALAARVGGQMDILSLDQLQQGLNLADIVITYRQPKYPHYTRNGQSGTETTPI